MNRHDLLVINKTDLAPMVGASLEAMARDSHWMRGLASWRSATGGQEMERGREPAPRTVD